MFLMPGSRARALPRQRDGLGYQLTALPTSGNNLIVTINQTQGAFDPFLEFRDPISANGDLFFRPIPNGGQFIINSGSTFATANNIPFRLWVLGFDNGGGITLGAFQSVTGGASPTAIAPLDESAVQTTTGGNGGNSAATFYAAQTLTGRPFRILGYLEWSAGLATAGVWNAKPTKIQLFGPGIKKPGDALQATLSTNSTADTGTASTAYVNNSSSAGSITPTSAINLVLVNFSATLTATGANFAYCRVIRGTAGSVQIGVSSSSNNSTTSGVSIVGFDAPGTTSSQTYTPQRRVNNAATTANMPNGDAGAQSLMLLTEIMV